MTPPEFLAGVRSGKASLAGEISALSASVQELSALVSEALDLCVRVRKLDNDLTKWETKARTAIGVVGENKA
jgi:hypothetical protein